jgi:hypothetical protein
MPAEFSVTLTSRTEIVEYRDSSGLYAFDVGKNGKEWIVYLPPSRQLPEAESDRQKILDRIRSCLPKRWWFWIYPVR